MNRVFAIFFAGKLLVVIEDREFVLPSEILDKYAKRYAFDRAKLTWSVVDYLTFNEVMLDKGENE